MDKIAVDPVTLSGFDKPVDGAKIRENIEAYVKMMEEMANAPKEEHGKRQPGEMCAYEKFSGKN